ncbi:MAG: HAD hydrolase-like protein [Sulfurimonas sp.]|nr:HAD hydrolase-like protein [Sulfurimonas sp.]
MIKTILWDFDGVILDSMKIKGDGFKELFQNYDEEYLSLMEKYHYAYGGVSRFEKIEYFHTEIIKETISEEKILQLADIFADIIEKKLHNTNNLIEESINFIKANYKKYNFHIVSGAEHKELNSLCEYFELSQYFKTINGSPTKKSILVKNVIKEYNYNHIEVILIGDAMTDYNAAKVNKIKFYGYNNIELKSYKNYIENFTRFRL